MGPRPLLRVLSNYREVLGLQFCFLSNSHASAAHSRHEPPASAAALAAYQAVREVCGLSELEPFSVKHVPHRTGLRLESKDGWKVVFSGDTRPCQAVIDAARGATLLVHEATCEDELQEAAIAKKHSTTAEALGVAAAAGAYRTVLTHFGNRSTHVRRTKPRAAADGVEAGSDLAAVGSVVVGFDLMSINLADLAWLPKALPVLDELFKEEEAAYQQDDEAPPADA
uniref:ribonuclease Z n=1 Tax=Tetradesmus obliquus TaxID=3088 RepID=A0A383WFV3_TETOB|eukprot:jgi/Sobl393_1/5076/SZX75924.1